MFEFNKTIEGEVVVLALKGQLDALTAGKIKPLLDDILENDHHRIVYDLKDLAIIDSSGVGVIVSTFKRTRVKGGDTRLACLTNQPQEVFRVLGLNRYMKIYETIDKAVASFVKNKKKKE